MTSAKQSALGSGVVASLAELVELRRAAPKLRSAPARRVAAPLSGPFVSPYRGRGLDFDEVRPYQPGDDVRNIDWRVTARTGRAHSKVFHEDRERPVWLFVDAGPTLRFGTRRAFKSVVAARAAALLAWAAHAAGERVGALVTGPGSLRELPTGARESHLFAVLDAMAKATAEPWQPGAAAPSMAALLARLGQRVRAGSRIFVLSDFYGLDDEGCDHLVRLARRCDLGCVWVYDGLEAEAPPPGRYRVSDGSRVRTISSQGRRRREAYGEAFAARRRDLTDLCRRHRMELTALRTDGDPVAALAPAFRHEPVPQWRRAA